MTLLLPKSVRLNNPLNIRFLAANNWQGLVPRLDMTPEQEAETEFCVFSEPCWGFRAAAIATRNAVMAGEVRTLADWVNHWAPASDANNVATYLADVSARSGINPDTNLTPTVYEQAFALLKAGAIHETCADAWGTYWTDEQLNDGLAKAGIFPDDRVGTV